MSFTSYSSSMVSPGSSPMSITKSASQVTRATPSEPLPIGVSALSQRRDSSTSFEFSSAVRDRKHSIARPSAYVSDADLWGLDEVPYLREAPAPPRSAEQWMVKPVAQPVAQPPVASAHRRRSSPLRSVSKSRSIKK